ncbi:MAG: hypothetical protein ABI171_06615 [Collimonas sp.]|uniref:hypothetical protein n=1 Tax=Collimonas sp. TaxID=1963772 RepID=UPI003267ECF5
MTDNMSKYTIYTLRGLPAGVFGEAYAIVTGTEVDQGEYTAEHFILTQLPNEALHMGTFDISGNSFPTELGIVDTDFALTEAQHQVEIDLFALLEKRATALGRPDVAYLPIELKLQPRPFVGCAMRGRFMKQFKIVEDATKCPSLARYLGYLQQIKVIRYGG